MQLKQVLGFVVALFSLGVIGVGLYLYLVRPAGYGYPDALLVKSVVCGVFGFFGVMMGYGIMLEPAETANKAQQPVESAGKQDAGA